ncbi:hypothetical protein GN316_15205 [Xylophilus sp. Kf1]|nr:hypothetical protein [Xylophilus sp. Kf1]
MHHPRPRYIRATFFTLISISLLPLSFLAFAYHEYKSPNWDPNGDSGAIQGFVYILVATLIFVCYATVAFPAVACRLHRRQNLRARPFLAALAGWLFGISVIFAVAFSIYAESFFPFVPLTLILFSLGAVICLPFGFMWIRLAI